MAAAIAAGRQGAEVVILEGNDRLGKKILATGNGKCNLGNEKLSSEEYYTGCPEFLENCLDRFGTKETLRFFAETGLMIKSRNGYLYPMSEQAASVLDVLRYRVEEAGVRVITGCRIEKIEKIKKTAASGGSFLLTGTEGEFRFDRVILACGGCAAPKTGSDGSGFMLAEMLGHRIVPTVPALVQLRCREDYFKAVAGVRAEASLTVSYKGKTAAAERGELLLTDYGISGIPVFQLSRVVNYILLEKGKREGNQVEIAIDFLPDQSRKAWEKFLREREKNVGLQGERTLEEFFTGLLHKKLMLLFIRLAGLKPSEKIREADPGKVRQVYGLCRQWKVHVTGSNSYEHAQVCAGGVALDEIKENMESGIVPGLYFAGEILDVDGKCGGYNLQWAWCSGYLAGQAASGKE